MQTISIESYNPEWTQIFTKESEEIQAVFPGTVIIEHVGSTSVPGLDAKPVIDIMVGLKELDTSSIIQNMESLGYEHWKEDTFQNVRLMFTRWNQDKSKRLVNVHITILENDFWSELILLRDTLRTNPEVAKQYSELKIKLAEIYRTDPEGYTAAKTDFIKHILNS